MTRINLLKNTLAANLDAASSKELQKRAGINFFVIIIFPVLVWYYQSSNIGAKTDTRNGLQAQAAEAEERFNKVTAEEQELNKIKEENKKLLERLASYKTLVKNRLREVKSLDLIQTLIPEKVSIESMEFKETAVFIKGQTFTEEDLNLFTRALDESPVFSNVIVTAMTSKVDGSNGKVFDLSLTIEESP